MVSEGDRVGIGRRWRPPPGIAGTLTVHRGGFHRNRSIGPNRVRADAQPDVNIRKRLDAVTRLC
jgi:hypothetical protein